MRNFLSPDFNFKTIILSEKSVIVSALRFYFTFKISCHVALQSFHTSEYSYLEILIGSKRP